MDRLDNQAIACTTATENGDAIMTRILYSLDEDGRWHREWTAALMRHIVDDNPANAEAGVGWIEKWSPLASEALEAFARITPDAPVPPQPSAVTPRVTAEVSRGLGQMPEH